VQEAFALLRAPELDWTAVLPAAARRALHASVTALVLATDMQRHDAMLAELAAVAPRVQRAAAALRAAQAAADAADAADAPAEPAASEPAADAAPPTPPMPHAQHLNDADAAVVLKVALKVADLGHTRAAEALHRRWVTRLCDELFAQGDHARALGMRVGPLFSRRRASAVPGALAALQVKFFGMFAVPLASAWADATLSPAWAAATAANEASWQRQLATLRPGPASASASAPQLSGSGGAAGAGRIQRPCSAPAPTLSMRVHAHGDDDELGGGAPGGSSSGSSSDEDMWGVGLLGGAGSASAPRCALCGLSRAFARPGSSGGASPRAAGSPRSAHGRRAASRAPRFSESDSVRCRAPPERERLLRDFGSRLGGGGAAAVDALLEAERCIRIDADEETDEASDGDDVFGSGDCGDERDSVLLSGAAPPRGVQRMRRRSAAQCCTCAAGPAAAAAARAAGDAAAAAAAGALAATR
jgi:hypothetical protein